MLLTSGGFPESTLETTVKLSDEFTDMLTA
jgi:hypothetical protein